MVGVAVAVGVAVGVASHEPREHPGDIQSTRRDDRELPLCLSGPGSPRFVQTSEVDEPTVRPLDR